MSQANISANNNVKSGQIYEMSSHNGEKWRNYHVTILSEVDNPMPSRTNFSTNLYHEQAVNIWNITQYDKIFKVNITELDGEKQTFSNTIISLSELSPLKLVVKGGNDVKYVNLKGGGKRVIRHGKRGGRYYMKGGNKHYI